MTVNGLHWACQHWHLRIVAAAIMMYYPGLSHGAAGSDDPPRVGRTAGYVGRGGLPPTAAHYLPHLFRDP